MSENSSTSVVSLGPSRSESSGQYPGLPVKLTSTTGSPATSASTAAVEQQLTKTSALDRHSSIENSTGTGCRFPGRISTATAEKKF